MCISTLCRLAQENEVKSAQSKIREVQKENDELMRQLSKKERECEAKTQEKEEVMQVRLLYDHVDTIPTGLCGYNSYRIMWIQFLQDHVDTIKNYF